MYQARNGVLRALGRWLTGGSNQSNAASTGRRYARGAYRSSRDTAAGRLRGEDARLSGTAEQGQPAAGPPDNHHLSL